MQRSAALLLAMIVTTTSRAESIDAFKSSHLLGGTFAPDCGKPAAPSNARLSFGDDASAVSVTQTSGPQSPSETYLIRQAHKQPDGSLAFTAEKQGSHESHEVVYMLGKDDDGFRAMSIRVTAADGASVIVDRGALIKSGAETLWFRRCQP